MLIPDVRVPASMGGWPPYCVTWDGSTNQIAQFLINQAGRGKHLLDKLVPHA